MNVLLLITFQRSSRRGRGRGWRRSNQCQSGSEQVKAAVQILDRISDHLRVRFLHIAAQHTLSAALRGAKRGIANKCEQT